MNDDEGEQFEQEGDLNLLIFLLLCTTQQQKIPPPGGLEPPTFRSTAERASQLRHGGFMSYGKLE